MAYRDLYERCQKIGPLPIHRNQIRDAIIELLPAQGYAVIRSTIDTSLMLGYFVDPTNKEHQFVRQTGGSPVVVVARGLNRCWERFVTIKEAMHIFDDPLQKTNTAADLESVLSGLFAAAPQGEWSPQLKSEVGCFWMALALFCPEPTRIELQRKRENGELTDLQIATMLRIPEKYVPHLFFARFKEIVTRLLVAG